MHNFKVIAFDADDTLWDNQTYFDKAEETFIEVLKDFGSPEFLSDTLYDTESANMPILGYGAKAVCISMMETALKITENTISASDMGKILAAATALLHIPAEPLPEVEKTLELLRDSHKFKMILLTKGDMLDQQNKIDRSGLEKYFDRTVIVPNKGKKEYSQLCAEESVSPEEFLMVGNSFKSDIQPVIEIGGYGIHIPFHTIWRHEVVKETPHPNVTKIERFGMLPEIIQL